MSQIHQVYWGYSSPSSSTWIQRRTEMVVCHRQRLTLTLRCLSVYVCAADVRRRNRIQNVPLLRCPLPLGHLVECRQSVGGPPSCGESRSKQRGKSKCATVNVRICTVQTILYNTRHITHHIQALRSKHQYLLGGDDGRSVRIARVTTIGLSNGKCRRTRDPR